MTRSLCPSSSIFMCPLAFVSLTVFSVCLCAVNIASNAILITKQQAKEVMMHCLPVSEAVLQVHAHVS